MLCSFLKLTLILNLSGQTQDVLAQNQHGRPSLIESDIERGECVTLEHVVNREYLEIINLINEEQHEDISINISQNNPKSSFSPGQNNAWAVMQGRI